jgi:hypothetical protein
MIKDISVDVIDYMAKENDLCYVDLNNNTDTIPIRLVYGGNVDLEIIDLSEDHD